MKHLFYKNVVERKFEPEDLVLMWNARIEDKGEYANFNPIWLGPYLIDSRWEEDSYILRELNGGILELLVHG